MVRSGSGSCSTIIGSRSTIGSRSSSSGSNSRRIIKWYCCGGRIDSSIDDIMTMVLLLIEEFAVCFVELSFKGSGCEASGGSGGNRSGSSSICASVGWSSVDNSIGGKKRRRRGSNCCIEMK